MYHGHGRGLKQGQARWVCSVILVGAGTTLQKRKIDVTSYVPSMFERWLVLEIRDHQMEDYKYITNLKSLLYSILCLILSPSACNMLELLLILFLHRVNLFFLLPCAGYCDAKVDAFLARSKFNQAEMAVYRRGFPQMP